jgi:glycosyltransferase involved in cell wall biosynthesis
MASAKPVVATAVGCVPDIVLDGQTGILAPSGDADRLATAITDLLQDPDRRQEFGERGREFVREKYTKERLCDDIEKLYSKLLSARAK